MAKPPTRPRTRPEKPDTPAPAGAPSTAAGPSERLTGTHSVREALRARRRSLHRLWIHARDEGRELRALRPLAEAAGVAVEEVERLPCEAGGAGRRRGGSNPQGVELEAGPLPQLALGQLVGGAVLGEGADRSARLVVLDGVEDPHNLGAIARVAEGSGAAGLVLSSRRAPPLSPAVARASAGAIEWLPVARVGNLARALDCLRDEGFWTLGADLEAELSLYELPTRLTRGRLAIVLGAEGRGLRPGIQRRIDHAVRIPMRGRIHSLNVASATGVLLYELLRRSAVPVSCS